ncbi:ankyrin repeat protein [Blastomyces dermatitidis ATCC 18188]|uniref:Ankyrin repeat protein n=1 Tax=Ajellomyces dermatitidis (strain ATCC 18188 / CBS 674.68) TaxID=653446 RepID=F2TJG6_AJEDA|nr:ankyrin repeat protein [Blastomyces dermatitidis ATCC 18188]
MEALARLLLSYNDAENRRVDPNCADAMYRLSPLTIAAIKGHTNIVKLLHGTLGTLFVDVTNIGRTPLSFAVENGHVEISSRLRAHNDHQRPGFRPRHWSYYSRLLPPDLPPLQWMPMPAYEAIVDLLLKGRGALEATDRDGRTALCLAAECGYEEGVEILLKKGAALQPPDRSPLLFALANEHTSIVRILLEGDTAQTLHAVSDGRMTPLNLAASRGNEEMVKLFLQKTVHQEHACFSSSWRPLIEASREGHTGVVEFLVEFLLAEQARRWPGYSSLWQPLFWAAYGGYVTWWDCYSQPGEHLMWATAAMHGHTLVAELLLETGKCDVNARDQHGWAPLTWASRSSDEEMVYPLLENGADSEYIDAPSPPPVFRYGDIPLGHVASLLSSVDGDEAPLLLPSLEPFKPSTLAWQKLRFFRCDVRDMAQFEFTNGVNKYERIIASENKWEGYREYTNMLHTPNTTGKKEGQNAGTYAGDVYTRSESLMVGQMIDGQARDGLLVAGVSVIPISLTTASGIKAGPRQWRKGESCFADRGEKEMLQ